jgi:tetratricopeptide (TPR) repeat protein
VDWAHAQRTPALGDTCTKAAISTMRNQDQRAVPALRFQALGVPLELRASFLLVVVLIGLPTHLSPASLLAWVAIATAGVLVHEAGHAGAFVVFGSRPEITLHALGGHTLGASLGTRQMVAISAAGPLVGLAVGLGIVALTPLVPSDPDAQRLIDDALLVTIGLSLLNLVPLGSFDGNRVLSGLVATATGGPPGVTARVLGAISVILLIVAVLVLGMTSAAICLIVIAGLEWRSMIGRIDGPEDTGPAALLRLGRPDAAIASADAVLRRTPGDIGTRRARAAALVMMTRYPEAEAAYTDILAQAPGDLLSLAGRSAALRALGKVAAADRDLSRLLADPPRDINGVTAQFRGLYQAHRYAAALTLIRSELARSDLRPGETYLLRLFEAVLECATDDAGSAWGHAQVLAGARPEDPAGHEILARAALQLDRRAEALRHANRALAGAPGHPELLETLGLIERMNGRPERGYDALIKAAVGRPGLPRARAELSACFTQLGRDAEASAALADLPPWTIDDPFVRYARGCILASAGQSERALEEIARAVQTRPGLGPIARLDPNLAPWSDAVGHPEPQRLRDAARVPPDMVAG